MLYFNHKKCTRYFKSFILNLFEIEILNDESLYNMYRVFSCHFSRKISHFPCLNLAPGHHRRLARLLAAICIFARVRIFGTLVPFLCNREFLRISYYIKKRRRSTRSRAKYRLSVFNCCPPRRSRSAVCFLHVFHILKNIAEIKCSEVVLRSLRPADHLDTAVFLEKKLRAL